jgi:hypothetical protein
MEERNICKCIMTFNETSVSLIVEERRAQKIVVLKLQHLHSGSYPMHCPELKEVKDYGSTYLEDMTQM